MIFFRKSKLCWTCFLLENENQIYNNWKMWAFIEKETLHSCMLTLGMSSYLPSPAITSWLWPDIALVRKNNYKRFYLQWSWMWKWNKTEFSLTTSLISVKFSGNTIQYKMIAMLYYSFFILCQIIYTFICDKKLHNRNTKYICECHGNYKWV